MLLMVVLVGLALAGVSYQLLLPAYSESQSNSREPIERWFNDPASRRVLTTTLHQQACPGAPFILPSDGLIGLLWHDPLSPYTILNAHTGIDIFGDGEPGNVPVYAAYTVYLTRLTDWLASVIIRHDHPLQNGHIIWTYYTHMASRDGSQSYIEPAFPPGSVDVPVDQGTLLGYQGEYAGSGRPPIGMHVHFSIVLSDDAGAFTNEAIIGNTLDPSPYLGMSLNIADWPVRPIHCRKMN
jgi:hypothetical protein